MGLKPEHYREIIETSPEIGWFEIHAENYMGEGGPPHHYLGAIRERYPVSLHGVGLSIGGAGPLDREHLTRLKALIERYEPASFSEHLAWSSHDSVYLNDLLPLPYTEEALDVLVRNIDRVQGRLKRPILMENPSTYLAFIHSTIPEGEFLAEMARRSGCGLLLDVNNLYVNQRNHDHPARAAMEALDPATVGEIHVAGHHVAALGDAELLIDDHGSAVDAAVWSLYAEVIASCGPLPTLIEWDNDVPAWPVLFAQAQQAQRVLDGAYARRADEVAA